VTSCTPLKEKKGAAGDGIYQTFHIHPFSVSGAPIYTCNSLHQMLTNFQDDNLLPYVNSSPQLKTFQVVKKLGCLTNSCLTSCNIKFGVNLFIDLVTTSSSSMHCDLNDDTGVATKEMNDSNDFVHENSNRFTICNIGDGLCGGPVNTGGGFNPSSSGYVRNLCSICVVLCNSEKEDVKDSTSLAQFHNTSLVISVGEETSLFDLDCDFQNCGTPTSEFWFGPVVSKITYLHSMGKSLALNYFDTHAEQLISNCCSSYFRCKCIDILYSPMILGSDYTACLPSTVLSHGIVHDSPIPTKSSEDSRCIMCCSSIIKFMELNNSEVLSSSRCVLKTSYDGNKFMHLTNLKHLCYVCELTGSNFNWTLVLSCTLQDTHSFSVAQEILNNLIRNSGLHVAPVFSGQINFSSKHSAHDYEMGNISDSLAGFLSRNYSNLHHLPLRQNCQAIINCRREDIYLPKWSTVLEQFMSSSCIDNYSECQFSMFNCIADLRGDSYSHVIIPTISLHGITHHASSLIQLYPFCNCSLLHWLLSDLLDGPLLNLSFRYQYRSYSLLCLVSEFKRWFLSVSDNNRLRNRLLCAIHFERPYLQH